VTDKKTIEIIEKLSDKVSELQVTSAKNSLLMNIILWVMGAILVAILPAFGFLIAHWVNSKN
jgi:hypothetical protein